MLNKSYKINFENFSKIFSLPKQIIGEDFESLDAIYLKVILLIFENADKNYSEVLLANLLNCKQEKISNAIDYWIKKGILIQLNNKQAIKDVNVFSKSIATKIVKPSNNNEISFLLERMESIFARPISSQERQNVTEILEFVRLPADVILMAIDYCVSIDKPTPKFIKRVCISWADKGIVTHELAEQFLGLLKEKK
ncbi:MAG: DnaD domain protein, partial [Oscillospiraceae bacterium]